MSLRRCLLLTWFTAAGCGTSFSYVASNPLPHAMQPRDPARLEVRTTTPSGRSYVEVGVLTLDDLGVACCSNLSDVEAPLRVHAARLGCDALVVQGPSYVLSGGLKAARYLGACLVYR